MRSWHYAWPAMGLSLIFMSAVVAASLTLQRVDAAEAPVTYNRQIAPILYQHCTACHHSGGSGPFSLLTYNEAKRWGSVMAEATRTRYMPPWLPSGPHGEFEGDRRMSAEEIALIQQWVQAGMAEGAAGETPKPPRYTSGWQLGPPDLVLEMDTPMTVPASGTDLYRNFVLPVPLKQTRWIRAMEIRPGTPQLVHHANLLVDRSASMRRSHPDDWQRGIPGMDVMVDAGDSFDPDSHFLDWKPDATALVEAPGLPWRLDPGNDLVLNMHLKPTGKPEVVRAQVGLYFAQLPATRFPMLLQLENDDALHIPAGDRSFVVEDELELPVAVDLLALYPHAHYLGKRMEGWAQLPDGSRRQLLLIEDWDIDRQSIYRFAQPISLPKGTVVHMRYSYDNSASNPHNPSAPPVAVDAGNRSADEMGHLWLQVLPHADPGAGDARAPLLRAWMEHRLQKAPSDPIALFNVASLDAAEGKDADAIALYRRAAAVQPKEPRTLTALAAALNRAGQRQQARDLLLEATAADPAYADAHFDLGTLETEQGEFASAEQQFRTVLRQQPDDGAARSALGSVLLAMGREQDARQEFEAALRLEPSDFTSHYNLAMLLLQAGQVEEALKHLQAAEALNPNDADVHKVLVDIYTRRGDHVNATREQQAVAKTSF